MLRPSPISRTACLAALALCLRALVGVAHAHESGAVSGGAAPIAVSSGDEHARDAGTCPLCDLAKTDIAPAAPVAPLIAPVVRAAAPAPSSVASPSRPYSHALPRAPPRA